MQQTPQETGVHLTRERGAQEVLPAHGVRVPRGGGALHGRRGAPVQLPGNLGGARCAVQGWRCKRVVVWREKQCYQAGKCCVVGFGF